MSIMESSQETLFGNPVSPGLRRKAMRMRNRFARKYGYTGTDRYPLSAEDNPVLGFLDVKNIVSGTGGEAIDAERGIVISTIRMGYGHYRISMALASAAHALGFTPYWFDLLAFDTAGARMISDLERWYSFFSRLSQKSRLFNRLLWDPLLGKWYKRLEKSYPAMKTSEIVTDIHLDLPPDIAFLGTHPLNAQGAVLAGMRNVVNVVPDNCPLGFHLADGAVQAVQSPSAYQRFRTLYGMSPKRGPLQNIPADLLFMAGHYIDHELAENIEADCAARLTRIEKRGPRRLLISIGGAGAQQRLLMDLVAWLLPRIRGGEVTLYINFGDHRNAWEAFCEGVPGFHDTASLHTDWTETVALGGQAISGDFEGLHAFLHDNPFSAVYATNLFMRPCDILLTKPSELAYYPVPKLMLERVGGHEAWGAIRASELGDGTIECAGTEFTKHILDLMLREDDLLTMCCEHILHQHRLGVYNGAYRVVERAMSMKANHR